MNVTQQMIGILRDSQTRRIRFNFTGSTGANISIDPTSFERVAAGLQSGNLKVVENRFTIDKAVYSAFDDPTNNTDANTFYLGRNNRWSRSFNALIVHESVHAFMDLSKTTIPWLDNEAAAYIAQGFYLRNSGYALSRIPLGSEQRIGFMWVEDFINNGESSMLLDGLRDSLNSNEDYQSYIGGTFVGDG